MGTSPAALSRIVLWLLAASLSTAAGAAEPEVSLAEAVRQTLAANLDLAAERRALAADAEEIGIARSTLLPQITLGARAAWIDDDRSDSKRGNTTERSGNLAAGLNQVLYDETAWADYEIQKLVYTGQAQQFEAFRLEVVQEAADAFLELDRSRALLADQESNRELTRRNLVTSQQRVNAGWSGEREVLRWQSQLAGNDRQVVADRTSTLVNRFELNRVRNLPPEAPATTRAASIEEEGFVYAREPVLQAIASPEGDRRLRDFLVQFGRDRSPVLAAFDAAIAAAERLLTANRRAFWVPSLSFIAGVDYLAANSNSSATFNETEWGVGAELMFPLLEGGSKFAELRQTGEVLSGLRIERRSQSQVIEEGIRSSFAEASGSYTNLTLARQQQATARRYFDIVDESYIVGVGTILDLLDAQSQLLNAQIGVTNAHYDFLEDLIEAERQLSYFPFLEPDSAVTELMGRLEQGLRASP